MKYAKFYTLTTILAGTLLISACNNSNNSLNNSATSNILSHQEEKANSTSNPSSKSVQIGEESYSIPLNDEKTKKYNFAVNTLAGIVWLPAPKMEIAPGTETNPFYFPTEPFVFYLSSPNEKILTLEKSKKLFTLPLKDSAATLIVDDLFGFGDYILYHTSSVFTDGAQPLRQQTWIMKVEDPSYNRVINEFHSTGGDSYKYATDQIENLYIWVSVTPGNSDGSSNSEAYVYNISTGKKVKLEDYSLSGQSSDSIKFNYNDKEYTYKLQTK
ncbi:hypothetical protein MKZ24_05590 [Paenibacillus sp. FSL R7-0297]|uniref:hypothetical protein n=1 Tax=unclassified Paenibacillus TaxID=185978 RepID=UPI0004F8EF1F|nr:hypothetical protein [Paenibacillus sp. FSL R5-0912]AIQ44312.1 hypothetical protein R50912_33230 [Paenibacillus sp. FSL R5-0912]